MSVTEKTLIGTIDLTPTWEALMPALVAAAAEGSVAAMGELVKLARIVDHHIANLKKLEGAG